MNDDKRKVEVSIMGKLYSVLCPLQQQEELEEAVSFLNNQAEDLKHRAQGMKSSEVTWNRDNLLAVIALNLSYELIKLNTRVSGKAMEAEKLVERIKNSFAQSDVDDAAHKISEISL